MRRSFTYASATMRMNPSMVVLALAASFASDTRADVEGEPVRTVILEPRLEVDVGRQVSGALEDVVHARFAADTRRSVVALRDIKELAQHQANRSIVGCREGDCIVQLAAAVKADRLVLVSLLPLREKALLVITELDGETARPLSRAEDVVALDAKEVLSAARTLSASVLAADQQNTTVARGRTGQIEVTTEPPGALVEIGGRPIGSTPTQPESFVPGATSLRAVDGAGNVIDMGVEIVEGHRTSVRVDFGKQVVATEAQLLEHAQAMMWHDLTVNGRILLGGASWLLLAVPISFASYLAYDLIAFGDTKADYPGELSTVLIVWGLIAAFGLPVSGLTAWGFWDKAHPPPPPLTGISRHRVSVVVDDGSPPRVFELDAMDPTARAPEAGR